MAKLIMVGQCPHCKKEITSRYPFEIGECKCRNPPVQFSLQLAIIPAKRHMKVIQRISELSGVPVEKLVNALLEEAGKQVLAGKLTLKYRL